MLSVNLPDVAVDDTGEHGAARVPARVRWASSRRASPAQIRDPDTDAPLSLHDTGMLWVKGPNIFEGYLDQPEKTAEVLHDGWFKTGDLGRFDEDGFLFIEGRLSRFSKIAGEMVPHETVEARIGEALGASARAASARWWSWASPTRRRARRWCVLTTVDIDQADLRAKLAALGVPNLWVPKIIKRVEAIPVLGSGKLDLKRCKELALG